MPGRRKVKSALKPFPASGRVTKVAFATPRSTHAGAKRWYDGFEYNSAATTDAAGKAHVLRALPTTRKCPIGDGVKSCKGLITSRLPLAAGSTSDRCRQRSHCDWKAPLGMRRIKAVYFGTTGARGRLRGPGMSASQASSIWPTSWPTLRAADRLSRRQYGRSGLATSTSDSFQGRGPCRSRSRAGCLLMP